MSHSHLTISARKQGEYQSDDGASAAPKQPRLKFGKSAEDTDKKVPHCSFNSSLCLALVFFCFPPNFFVVLLYIFNGVLVLEEN